MLHDAADGLDTRPLPEIATVLLDAQMAAVAAVRPALGDISRAARSLTQCVRRGGGLHYAAAGSSGLMAMADAAELPGTFGIAPERISIAMAGGIPSTADMPGGAEDDARDGAARAQAVARGDAAIVVAASGATPFAIGFAQAAKRRGAVVIALANNEQAPLFDHAHHSICLPTPPEVIAGSTRMGAGSAQKAALNILSTLLGVALGHVHDGMMVNLRADNAKLTARARRTIQRIAHVGDKAAGQALNDAAGEVKPAVLIAAGTRSVARARALLDAAGGNLRAALLRAAQSP